MASTPKQLLEQSSRHAVHLESLKAQDWKELRSILSDIERDLLGRIAAEDFKVMTRVQMERRLKATGAMLSKRYDADLIPELNKQIRDLAEYEAGFELRSLGNVAPKYQFDLPTKTQLITAVTVNPLSVKGRDEGMLLDAFIKKWTDNDITNFVNIIRAGYAQGLTNSQIIGNLKDVAIPANRRTLETVTRTALQHAANQARQAVWNKNSDIIKGVRWLSVLDGRTSQLCQGLSGQTFPLDSGPRPPLHLNCVSGDTNVTTRSGISNIYKRRYKGAVIKIVTEAGRTLTITPNHPILTARGWVKAGEVNRLDKLACIRNLAFIEGDKKDSVKAPIADIFAAADVSADSFSITNRPASTKDFHGDFSDSEVSVISVDCFAWDNIRKIIAQNRENKLFVFRPFVNFSFFSLGAANSLLNRNFSTPKCIVSGFSKAGNLFRRTTAHSCRLLLASVSNFITSFIKICLDKARRSAYSLSYSADSDSIFKHRNDVGSVNLCGDSIVFGGDVQAKSFCPTIENIRSNPTDGKSFRKTFSSFDKIRSNFARVISFLPIGFNLFRCDSHFMKPAVETRFCNSGDFSALLDGVAGVVELDSVVKCDRVNDFTGHVYNLQNKENWYLSNDIITHNCRSSTVAVLDDRFSFLEEGGTQRARDLETGKVYSVPANQTYYSWLKTQPAEFQDNVIGPTRGKLLRNGGLTAQRFQELQLGRNFKPLTIEEMKKLEPLAFQKANIE